MVAAAKAAIVTAAANAAANAAQAAVRAPVRPTPVTFPSSVPDACGGGGGGVASLSAGAAYGDYRLKSMMLSLNFYNNLIANICENHRPTSGTNLTWLYRD